MGATDVGHHLQSLGFPRPHTPFEADAEASFRADVVRAEGIDEY